MLTTTPRMDATRWTTREEAERAADRASDELPQEGYGFTVYEAMDDEGGFQVMVDSQGELRGWLKDS